MSSNQRGSSQPDQFEILDYNHERDYEAVRQIWIDVGWLDADDFEDDEKGLELMLGCSKTIVFPVRGIAECSVISQRGHMRYLNEDLDLGIISAVTTSHVAKRMGAARKLTADSLATLAEEGAEIAALGMFDQGFYNQVGFGSGSYFSEVHFDPNTLTITNRFRPPARLGADDWQAMHTAMCHRKPWHGGCRISAAETMQAECIWADKAFGLGYYEGPDGELSHFFWGESEGQHGPYKITFIAYQSSEQLFELLALIKSLGDQVHKVQMESPAEVQFQDRLEQPFRHRRVTEGSDHQNWHEVNAVWQARILNIEKCIAKTKLPGSSPIRFNLRLTDPVSNHLPRKRNWQGVAGDYVVTLGEQSFAQPGVEDGLDTLNASVGAFTRMWLGVRNASALALTDDLAGSDTLLRSLDQALHLPSPHFGWDF